MERVVNGYYADDKSTRDIIGITPEEFGCLIMVLQNYYMQIEQLWGLPEKERNALLLQTIAVFKENDMHTQLDEKALISNIDEALNFMAAQHAIIYNFLTVINQPYPGASYPPDDFYPVD